MSLVESPVAALAIVYNIGQLASILHKLQKMSFAGVVCLLREMGDTITEIRDSTHHIVPPDLKNDNISLSCGYLARLYYGTTRVRHTFHL